jgi:hypothetical protein
MASLTLSLAAALTACWSATPEPITTVVTAISEAFQVTSVQAFNTGVNSQAATGTTASSTGISISFDQPVNRASVEQSVNIFEGEINHDTNPTPNQFTKLGLTSMCNGYWRVRNPNTMPISFTWDAFKTPENGAGVVQANSDTFFTSSLNADTIRVHVNNKQQQVKAKNPAACTSSPMTFAWAADSKSVVASPKTALVLNKTYSVVVSTFAKNSSGSLALSVPYVSKVVVKAAAPQKETGTLAPGGEYRFANGVIVRSLDGELQSGVQVSVEQVSATEVLEPISSEFEYVGPVYRISVVANPSQSTRFDLEYGFPVPIDRRGQDVFPASLVPKNLITDGDDTEGFLWTAVGTPRTEQDKVFFSSGLADSTGRIFTLLTRKVGSMSSVNNLVQAADAKSKVVCDKYGAPKDCTTILNGFLNLGLLADSAYFEHINTMQLNLRELPAYKWEIHMVKSTYSNCGNLAPAVTAQQESVVPGRLRASQKITAQTALF